MEHNHLTLNKIISYRVALKFLTEAWKVVINSDYFIIDTIGKQLLTTADSISANIAEPCKFHNF